MFKNKNTHLQFTKKNSLLIFNFEKGSAPQIAPGELKKLKGKAETGELDVHSLANRANFIFKSFEDRLVELPKTFRSKLKQQIVGYFLNTADNYDKNAKKGLDKLEFKKYRRAMLSTATMILNKYAPSKAMIEARKKEKRAFTDYREEMEKLRRGEPKFTSKNDSFSTADLTNPERIQDEVLKMRSQSGTTQDEGEKMLKKIAMTKHSYKIWQSAGLKVKASGRFYGGDSREDINSEIRFINTSDILNRFQKKQKAIEAHGELLVKKGKLLKKLISQKRKQKLSEFDKKNEGRKSKELKNQKQYEGLLKIRVALLEEKGKLNTLSDVEKKILITNRKKKALVFTKKDRLSRAENVMEGALIQIDTALRNPKLSKSAKNRLEKNRKILSKKQNNLAFDIRSATRYEKQVKEGDSLSKKRKLAIENGCMRIDDYLGNTLNPSVRSLDDYLHALKVEQLENGTEREQIIAKYAKYDDVVDRLNAGVAENVLQNNLSNSFLITTLKKELDSVKDLSSLRSIGFLGRVSASFEGGSRTIKWALKDKLVNGALDPFAKWLSSGDIPVLREAGKIAGGVVTVASGLVELSQKILSTTSLVFGHPIDTLRGLSMLFRPSTAVEAWKKVFEATTSKKDWKNGHYIKAGTKTVANILLTATGLTATASGVNAARAVLIRTLGRGFMRRAVLATGAFFKGAGGSLHQSGRAFLGKVQNTARLLFTKKGLQSMATTLRGAWGKGLDKISAIKGNSLLLKLQKSYIAAKKIVKQKMIGPPSLSRSEATKILVTRNKELASQAYSFVKEINKTPVKPPLKYTEAQIKYTYNDLKSGMAHQMRLNPSWTAQRAMTEVLARRPELLRKLQEFKKRGYKFPKESDLMKNLNWKDIRDTEKIVAWKKQHKTAKTPPPMPAATVVGKPSKTKVIVKRGRRSGSAKPKTAEPAIAAVSKQGSSVTSKAAVINKTTTNVHNWVKAEIKKLTDWGISLKDAKKTVEKQWPGKYGTYKNVVTYEKILAEIEHVMVRQKCSFRSAEKIIQKKYIDGTYARAQFARYQKIAKVKSQLPARASSAPKPASSAPKPAAGKDSVETVVKRKPKRAS